MYEIYWEGLRGETSDLRTVSVEGIRKMMHISFLTNKKKNEEKKIFFSEEKKNEIVKKFTEILISDYSSDVRHRVLISLEFLSHYIPSVVQNYTLSSLFNFIQFFLHKIFKIEKKNLKNEKNFGIIENNQSENLLPLSVLEGESVSESLSFPLLLDSLTVFSLNFALFPSIFSHLSNFLFFSFQNRKKKKKKNFFNFFLSNKKKIQTVSEGEEERGMILNCMKKIIESVNKKTNEGGGEGGNVFDALLSSFLFPFLKIISEENIHFPTQHSQSIIHIFSLLSQFFSPE